jgi:hypothetical protein
MHKTSKTHLERINKHAKAGYWALIFWIPLVVTAAMAFDAPSSQSHILPWGFLVFVLLLPVLMLFAPRMARSALERGSVKSAYAIVLTPQALILAPMLSALAIAAAGAWKL